LPAISAGLSIVPTILHEFGHLLGISTNRLLITFPGETLYRMARLTLCPFQHFIEERLDSLFSVQDVREEIVERLLVFNMKKKDSSELF
jgi:hypothetical protein